MKPSIFGAFWKQSIQKPGPSTHTVAWDRCVDHVRSKNPNADPYAVCTASLGESSFKSQDDFIKRADEILDAMAKGVDMFKSFWKKKAVNTSFAGGTPSSLLADQDLEGTTTKSHILGDVDDMIKDEEEGARAYHDAALETSDGFHADQLHQMANDEFNHKRNLERMKENEENETKLVAEQAVKSFKDFWKNKFNK